MSPAFGQASVECSGFHFPKAVLQTFKSHVEAWLLNRFENPPTFHVRLERDKMGRLCLCKLDLYDGSRWYRTSQYADDTQSALNQCLEKMVELIPLHNNWRRGFTFESGAQTRGF